MRQRIAELESNTERLQERLRQAEAIIAAQKTLSEILGLPGATGESATLAERLIAATCAKQGIRSGELTVHADRGTAMTAKSVALLLADLGVTRTHSRPHVSDDNPYSEAQFKTLKSHPTFPERFGSVQDARAFCQGFFPWYNTEHRHDALGLLTPEAVHYGWVEASSSSGGPFWRRPTPPTSSASSGSRPSRSRRPRRRGSTHRGRRRSQSRNTKCATSVSQSH